MPRYDYKCSKCGHIFEVQQRITEEPLKYCPECRGKVKRLISAAGIIFKGSGFHITDYSKKSTVGTKPEKKEKPKKEKKTKPKESKSKKVSE
ncbi:MAG: FmdB family zinc ribbon protein [Candidatus Margulisiibacteriota bacterium]|nr:FmdB family zinc ribbon protein [Candidatus Margulisiibacteriota bacterium]